MFLTESPFNPYIFSLGVGRKRLTERKRKKKSFLLLLWRRGFCATHADLNSGSDRRIFALPEFCFPSLPFHSPLIMEEAYSKRAYLNLYSSRTQWFVSLLKFPFSRHLCLSFLLSLLPPTSSWLSTQRCLAYRENDVSFSSLLWHAYCMPMCQRCHAYLVSVAEKWTPNWPQMQNISHWSASSGICTSDSYLPYM